MAKIGAFHISLSVEIYLWRTDLLLFLFFLKASLLP
jgi:hypothetical protein